MKKKRIVHEEMFGKNGNKQFFTRGNEHFSDEDIFDGNDSNTSTDNEITSEDSFEDLDDIVSPPPPPPPIPPSLSTLPSEWIEYIDDETGDLYWHNKTTDAVTWERPPEELQPSSPSSPPQSSSSPTTSPKTYIGWSFQDKVVLSLSLLLLLASLGIGFFPVASASPLLRQYQNTRLLQDNKCPNGCLVRDQGNEKKPDWNDISIAALTDKPRNDCASQIRLTCPSAFNLPPFRQPTQKKANKATLYCIEKCQIEKNDHVNILVNQFMNDVAVNDLVCGTIVSVQNCIQSCLEFKMKNEKINPGVIIQIGDCLYLSL